MSCRLTILLALMLSVLASASFAQSASPAPGSALSATSTSLVFVPYDKIAGPQLGQDQSVLLPYAEFLRLKGAATARPQGAEFRPAASLAQAVYQGVVEGDVVRLDAAFTIEALARPADAWEIRLPFHGAAIESATVEGPPASLGPLEKEAGFRLMLRGEGRRTVRLKLAVPLIADGAARRLEFIAPRAAGASISLQVGEDVVLERTPQALPATATVAPGGGTLIRASAGSSDQILLVFRPRMQATGVAAQARLSIEEAIQLGVSARGADAQVRMNASLLAGQTSSLVLELPVGVRLLGVTGPFVKDWSAPDAQRRVTVALVRELAQPFDLTLNVQFDAAVSTDSTSRLTVPEFRVPGAVQETGNILITPDPGLSIWPEQTDGLEAVSTLDKESAAARKFHFSQPGWKLTLTRRPMPARIRATGLALYEVTDELIRLKVRQHLAIGGRGIFSIAVQAPEGYELREAGPADLVSGFRQQGRRVEINLRGEQLKECDVEMLFQRPGLTAGARLTVEPVTVEGADENAGSLVLAMPLALRATEQESSGVEATDIRSLEEKLKPLITSDIEPVLGYRYFTPAARALALIEHQRTRLNCETALLAAITPSLMRVDATLNYNVEFSATDSFQLLIPASAGEDVRFSGKDIKEKTRTAPASGASTDTLTTWTIRLQRRVLGPYQLAASFDVPLPAETSGKGLTVDIPRVRATGVARETGFIAVSRGENLEVTVDKSEGLEPRDVKELPPSLASAFLGFRYFDSERHTLRLGLIRHDLENVLGALIRRMHVDTVLSDQREVVHEAIFEVQNNREQYLELRLPKGMEIWSAFVRGVPVRSTTRKSDGARLIELTKSESMDSAFRVRLILRQTLTGGSMGRHGSLVFALPEPLNIPVLRTTWKLFLPRGYRYVSFGGSMRQEVSGSPSWIEPAAETLLSDLPAELAGGIASPTLKPPDARVSAAYDGAESQDEKKARLQGVALEIPIVREGLQFEFSKLSGTGTIEVSYWKIKPLLILQGAFGLLLFALLAGMMRKGKRLPAGLAAVVIFFIMASLTSGLAGRLFATAVVASGAALLAGAAIFEWGRLRRNSPLEKPGTPPPASQPEPDETPLVKS